MTKFHEDRIKIVVFLLIVTFLDITKFAWTPSRHDSNSLNGVSSHSLGSGQYIRTVICMYYQFVSQSSPVDWQKQSKMSENEWFQLDFQTGFELIFFEAQNQNMLLINMVWNINIRCPLGVQAFIFYLRTPYIGDSEKNINS